MSSPKTIDTLVPDILGLFDGHSITDGIKGFQEELGAMFVKRFARYMEVQDGPSELYLSAIGKPLRQLWYQLKGQSGEKLTPDTKFKFLYGDLLESLVLFLAVEAGHAVEGLQRSVEVDGVRGRIDALIDGVLVDVKSCSPFAFDKFRSGEFLTNDPFGYVYQLSSYWSQLPVERAGFLCVDKTLGHIHFAELTNDKRRTDAEVRDRIARIREAVDSDVEPERCYEPRPISSKDKSGNLVLGVGCGYCPFKGHCWRDANNGEGLKKFMYSTGPKWFVKIEKQPRVQEFMPDTFPTKDT